MYVKNTTDSVFIRSVKSINLLLPEKKIIARDIIMVWKAPHNIFKIFKFVTDMNRKSKYDSNIEMHEFLQECKTTFSIESLTNIGIILEKQWYAN